MDVGKRELAATSAGMKNVRFDWRSDIQELKEADGRWVLARDANLVTRVES